jgi:hypothetical protein
MVGPDGQENVPHREWILMFEQAFKEVKEELAQQGRRHELLGAKVREVPTLFYSSGGLFLLDHILDHPKYHAGRIRLVHRGLHSSEERVPPPDCR